MKQSTLRQVLTIFETTNAPLSLPQIARDLGISVESLEGMIQHWVRKGKIRESGTLTECGSCGSKGACPFVMELPRSFELVSDHDAVLLPVIGVTCSHKAD